MRLHFLLLLALIAFATLFAACDQRPADPALPTTDVQWTTIQAASDTYHLPQAVWASGADDVYVGVVANRGQRDDRLDITHFDGASWTSIPVAWPDEISGMSIWGSGPADVYVATGRLNHFDGGTWTVLPVNANHVTGSSAGQVFIANSDVILESNGAEWDTLRTLDQRLGALVAARDGSLFAGSEGSVSAWNGSSWIDTAFPGVCAFDLCVFAYDDAYLLDPCTGIDKIYHWDGAQWTIEPVGVDRLTTLAGNGPSNVIAAGRDGTVVRYDGTSWEAESRTTALDLMVASGTPTGIVVAGAQNKVLWSGNSGWAVLREADLLYDRFAMCAESSDRGMVADIRSIYRFDRGDWCEAPLPFNSRVVNALAGQTVNDVYAIVQGYLIVHYNGSDWDAVDSLSTAQYSLWVSPDGTAYSVGDAAVYRRDTAWEPIKTGLFSLFTVTGDGGEGIVTTGVDFTTEDESVVWHFDGNAWSVLPPPGDYVRAMWSGPGMDLYAAGDRGIYHWDGARFLRIPGPEKSFYVIIAGTDDGRIVAMSPTDVAVYDGGLLRVSSAHGPDVATRATDGSIIAGVDRRIAFWRP